MNKIIPKWTIKTGVDQNARLIWLNKSITIINITIQLLDI